MTAIQCLFILLSLTIIFEVIIGTYFYLKYRSYRDIVGRDRNRFWFARMRTDLFEEVQSRRLDPNKLAFQLVYILMTDAIRKPDEFEEISKKLLLAISRDGGGSTKLSDELQIWSPKQKELLREMVNGLDSLMWNYSPIYIRAVLRVLIFIFRFIPYSKKNETLKMVRSMPRGAKEIEKLKMSLGEIQDGVICTA